LDREAVDQPVYDKDGTIDGQYHILGCHVAATIQSPGAKQDDHLHKLRQGEVDARGSSPLCDSLIKKVKR